MKAGEVVLIQAQINPPFSHQKELSLSLLGRELNIQTWLAWRDGKKIVFKEVK